MSRRSVIGKPVCPLPCRKSNRFPLTLRLPQALALFDTIFCTTLIVAGALLIFLILFLLHQVTSKFQAVQDIRSRQCTISLDPSTTNPAFPGCFKPFRRSFHSPDSDAAQSLILTQTPFIPIIHGCASPYDPRAGP